MLFLGRVLIYGILKAWSKYRALSRGLPHRKGFEARYAGRFVSTSSLSADS